MDLLHKILSNPLNRTVLKYLEIEVGKPCELLPLSEKKTYTNEGLEYFLEMGVPMESKYILNGSGVFVVLATGEITAFQFGRHNMAFRVLNPEKYIRINNNKWERLLIKLRLCDFKKNSIGYFSNIFGDQDTVVDIRFLGKEWALAINFVGDYEELMNEYYQSRVSEAIK